MSLRKQSAGLRRSPGEGNSNPLQDSCLGNPTVGLQKNRTQISGKTAARYITGCYCFKLFFRCTDQWHFSDYSLYLMLEHGNIVLVSGIQPSGSVMHIYISIYTYI